MLKKDRNSRFAGWRLVALRLGFLLPAMVLAVSFAMPAGSGLAQSLGGADALSGLQQRLGGSGLTDQLNLSDSTQSGQGNIVQQPALSVSGTPLPPSRLEQIMSARAGARLQQFGYNQLGRGAPVQIPQTGAVQDSYILGPGDQISVVLRGQESVQIRASVDRNGQVVLPRISPIAATGRSFGSFRQDVEAAVHRAFVATDAFVSVARVRQINVLVTGEVNIPGLRIVSGLASAVDALLLSGGVKKTGSLRNVRIVRGAHSYTVDLYGVLTSGGAAPAMTLADGDRIVVPPLGPTVAVTGLVRLPGIYELPARQTGLSARGLLALAGGQEVRGRYRMSVLRIDGEGRSQMASLPDQGAMVHDSEILFVQLGADQTTSQATLTGNTGLAGAYPVAPGARLSDVVRAPGALGNAPYTLFGIIVRKDPRTLLRGLVAFTPVAVLGGTENQELQPDDTIRPLQLSEASLLSDVVRAYLEKLAGDQAILRNPLIDQGAVAAAGPALPSATTLPAGVVAPPPAASLTGGIPTPPILPVSKADELSFALNDLTSAPPDVQRADILSLMDMRSAATPASGSAESIAEQQDQSGEQPVTPQFARERVQGANAPPVQTYPVVGANGLPLAGQVQQGQMGTAVPDMPAATARTLPAQNFQDVTIMSGRFAENREVRTFGELVRQLNVDPLVLINFLIEHRARLDGAVRGPGSYFVGPSVELADLVQAAGGTVNWADESGVEIITTAVDRQTGRAATQRQTLPLRPNTLASYIVRPRDTLRFNQAFTNVGVGAVTIQGEVRSAGSYPIIRGEHLSDLLARAGGLTNTAYPYGTVFLRKSAASAEHDGYIRAANEIENSLVNAMTRIGNDKIDPSAFASLQSFVNELRNQKAVGRISIAADPSVLAAKPELDPLLESGDLVYIPQRPSTISVLGQVSQPGSFPYRANLSPDDYVRMAGGYAALSDDSMTFVVLPDGSARRLEKSWLRFDSDALPPGSTIVVPRDVTPLDTRQLILDISSIFSQFAVSIASMAVLAKQ